MSVTSLLDRIRIFVASLPEKTNRPELGAAIQAHFLDVLSSIESLLASRQIDPFVELVTTEESASQGPPQGVRTIEVVNPQQVTEIDGQQWWHFPTSATSDGLIFQAF